MQHKTHYKIIKIFKTTIDGCEMGILVHMHTDRNNVYIGSAYPSFVGVEEGTCKEEYERRKPGCGCPIPSGYDKSGQLFQGAIHLQKNISSQALKL